MHYTRAMVMDQRRSIRRIWTYRTPLGLFLVAAMLLADLPTPLALVPTVQAQVGQAPFDAVWSSRETESGWGQSWGDVDGDGDLDLAVANVGRPGRVYRNDGGQLQGSWIFPDNDGTSSVAWGDLDSDGDLDLAVGNGSSELGGRPNRLYRNNGLAADGSLSFTAVWTSAEADNTSSIIWGDIDNDGDLDLIVGNRGQPTRIYRNNNGTLSANAVWSSNESGSTQSVALADYDRDGDLDIATGNGNWTNSWPCQGGQQNRLYRNSGSTTPSFTLAWSSSERECTYSLAWGDYDRDGDPDLLVGNARHSSRVYRNDAGKLVAAWANPTAIDTWSVAWGDYDNDGDLDIGTGNLNAANLVFRNDAGTFVQTWQSRDSDYTRSIAWADIDNDGDLDLSAMNSDQQPDRIYLNADGGLLPATGTQISRSAGSFSSLALGDADADGDLDMAVGSYQNGVGIYQNNRGGFAGRPSWASAGVLTVDLAWGDVDGDGDLDLAVINSGQKHQILRNDGPGPNGELRLSLLLELGPSSASAVAWGDIDNDGDLDLALAGGSTFAGQMLAGQNQLYRNDGPGSAGVPVFTLAWSSQENEVSTDLAWGDLDSDGDLDLAVANEGAPIRLYRNDGGTLSVQATWFSEGSGTSRSLAWGDVDGDGDLDLAVGNRWQPIQLYRNTNGTLETASSWSSYATPNTQAVAWGDYDSDGDLDLLAGNFGWEGQENILFRNDGNTLREEHVWQDSDSDLTNAIAWGDIDSDGDLDLVTASGANGGLRDYVRLYYNRRNNSVAGILPPVVSLNHAQSPVRAGLLATAIVQSSQVITIPFALRHAQSSPVRAVRGFYSLDGGGSWNPAITPNGTNIISSNLQVGTPLPLPPVEASQSFASNNVPRTISSSGSPTVQSTLVVALDGTIVDVDVIALRGTHSRMQDLTFTLASPSGKQAVLMNRSCGTTQNFNLSLDDEAVDTWPCPPNNGNTYRPATPLAAFNGLVASGTWTLIVRDSQNRSGGRLDGWGLRITTVQGGNSSVVPTPSENRYLWDTFASGFFGASDHVVFRLEALPDLRPLRGAAPTGYQYAQTAAQTLPFRMRGTQVRVVDTAGQPKLGAFVYRLASGQERGGELLPFTTDAQGYLQGRGALGLGDKLFAIAPAVMSDTYTLYHTSAAPTEQGLDSFVIAKSGVQQLTVSPDSPLALFDIELSLEWDASRDRSYLEQLSADLQRTSQYLYDWSNGRVALGNVIVNQNADNWAYANIVVQASNSLRPYAHQGGIVISPTIDPHNNAILYDAGQITIGSNWNRYGTPGANLGEDWPLILAHELSHYLFFLDDVYMGLDDQGHLAVVDSCVGSPMGDVYTDPSGAEFYWDEATWQANCSRTLTERTLGRNEWETISLWYPGLPTPSATNGGPQVMPFALTSVQVEAPITPTEVLEDPTFYLDYADGVAASAQAQVYLQRDRTGDGSYDYVIPLGGPTGGQNRIKAHGTQPGDRLCAFDPVRSQFGCEPVARGDDRITMERDTSWQPVVQLTPVTSTTFGLLVQGLPEGQLLQAQLFPELGDAYPSVGLSWDGSGYRGTFTTDYAEMSGHIQVWVDETASEANPRRETIVAYSIGGNPGRQRRGNGVQRRGNADLRASGGRQRRGNADLRVGDGRQRRGNAPVVSPDGQLTLFTPNPLVFQEGDFYTIQSMTGMPTLPPGRTLIGAGYRLVATVNAPVIDGSVSFEYLTDDVLVAGVAEEDLAIYHWDGTSWTMLPTTLDAYDNFATAASQGAGVYALLAGTPLVLEQPGWNLIAYPVRGTHAVTEALASIDGFYTQVFGFVPDGSSDPWTPYLAGQAESPWRRYDTSLPNWANTLTQLEFGRGYWISATQSVTLYLNVAPSSPHLLSAERAQAGQLAPPPAVFYGLVEGDATFVPQAGQEVVARIGESICGRAQTREVDGQIVYVVDVLAAGSGQIAGCGVAGSSVSFTVDGKLLPVQAQWHNGRSQSLVLRSTAPHPGLVFLPMIGR